MLKINRYKTGPLDVNTYLVCDLKEKKCIIIDLGSDIEKILKDIEEIGCKLEYILNTHGHFDHIWGEKEAQDLVKGLKVYINKEDEQMVNNLEDITRMWNLPLQNPPKVQTFDETSELKVGSVPIKVIHTPGHTKGGTCFLIEDKLFSGDTLFRLSVGRTDLPGGSFEEIEKSIKEKLFVLDDNIKVYPGHGEETTIGYEKLNNKFI